MATFEEGIQPLRVKIDHIDQALLGLLTMRSDLVGQVGVLKQQHGKSLQASDREAKMFQKLSERCAQLGLDTAYALELWSLIIWNSKIRECHEAGRTTFMNQDPVAPDILRKNLLALTAAVAKQYDEYCNGSATNAIRNYRAREEVAFNRALENVDCELALDIGCASGQVTRYLESRFKCVRAFDVSPDMIEEARKRKEWAPSVSFEQVDLEQKIPVEDGSVSFAIANFGAASEMGPNLLPELRRVLKPGGKALLSFYNRHALVNQWFYPWPSTVHVRGNPWNDTVEVWAAGSVFVVQGKSETVEELSLTLRGNGLQPDFWETHPTLGAVLPSVFFQEEGLFGDLVKSAQRIDQHLARSSSGINQGTYILTVVTRK